MVRHVVLVGLMGSGKTTVGRRLADRLERDFIDADDALVEIVSRSLSDFGAAAGDVGLRPIDA